MDANVDDVYLCALRHLNSTDENAQLFEERMQLDYVFLPLEMTLCVVSVLVSTLNTLIFTRKSMNKASLNWLLVALEISNIIFALCLIIRTAVLLTSGHQNRSEPLLIVEELAGILKYSAAYVINWLTVLIAAWRFIALSWPFRASSLLSRRRAAIAILILPFLCSFYAITYPLRYEFKSKTFLVCRDLVDTTIEETAGFYVARRKWSTDKGVISKRFTLSLSVLYYFLPCTCFVLITVGLVWTIYQHRKVRKTLCDEVSSAAVEKGQTRTTVILIVMLSFFLVGNILPLSFNLIEVWREHLDVNDRLLQNYFHYFFVSLFTNCFSFLAYYFMGTNFRTTFREMLLNCGIIRKTPPSNPSSIQFRNYQYKNVVECKC